MSTQGTQHPTIVQGRYVLQDKLQTGGMTTVYKAYDTQTNQQVALKRFDRDRYLPEVEREAFARELDALRNLSHPHIVKLLDSGTDENGKVFLVLELCKHDLIAEREANGQAFAGWDDFADLILLPLLDALVYAHQMDFAHRDVKPANVLIGFDGTVKIADFGISKLKRTLSPRITLNDFMSPPFSPPEADSGGYTYTRDIFSVGVLGLRAISGHRIAEYGDIERALEKFDAPPGIKQLVARAVAFTPADRPSSAAVFASEINQIQVKRNQAWNNEKRPKSAVSLTAKVMAQLQDELAMDDPNQVARFVSEDINADAFVQRMIDHYGTPEQKVRPEQYSIGGSVFRYHLAKNDRGYDEFAVLGYLRPEPHYLQNDRESSLCSPLTFVLDSRTGCIENSRAVELLERALEKFEAAKKERDRRDRESALFDTWQRVLNAKLQYDRDQSTPIEFSNATVEDCFVRLPTDGSDLRGIELGQGRVIQSKDARQIRGDVWEISPNEVVLNCSGASLEDMPSSGRATLDLYAQKVAIDRQSEAIDRIRSSTCVSSNLKQLLLTPGVAEPPVRNHPPSAETCKLLDESKRDAVSAALGARDILLVQGPPGTGKTQFIVALISEELERNPSARILLASQTHIAIDNALERLAERAKDIRILRIASDRSGAVAEASSPFLLNQQMKVWRDEIVENSLAGLEGWAVKQGLDPKDLHVGTLIRQIANLRSHIDQIRARHRDENQRREALPSSKETLSDIEYDVELERITNELQSLSIQLDAETKNLKRLESQLASIRDDARELLDLPITEQVEWADAFLGTTELGVNAERVVKLQSEWLDRFGSKRGFIKPLIERCSVVAATCVGLSSIKDASEVEFDLCIVDEASKATAMEACVPMARARRWVLVGDSKQLPPFQEEVLAQPSLRDRYDITGTDAEESLFERFRRLLPEANKVMLTTQYRMVIPIGRLISECFYDGKLESRRKSMKKALSSLTGYAVNWLSTYGLPARTEQPAGSSFLNPHEAGQICELLLRLNGNCARHNTNDPKEARPTVLVLSGYGAQVKHLDRRIAQIGHKLPNLDIEVCTVDRVQGRQADAVFFSVTRSNSKHKTGFLRELERINVALSRAKDLLVIVGDDEFVEQAEDAKPLQRVLAHIREWPAECLIDSLPLRHGARRES